ncbi:MAG: hypothetical protein M9894_03945 [Planctomycetes bacterium]|nr:hypothetical protein [Planctomycetota bacterium]
MSSRTLLTPFVLCLLAASAPAARGEGEQARDGQGLLAEAAGFDAALEGRHGFGIYMGGTKNLGTATLEVRRAEAPATYAVTARMTMTMGPNRRAGVDELLLDERLALISSHSTEEETRGDKTVKKTTTTRRDGDAWVREVVEDGGAPTTKRISARTPQYWDVPIFVLFLRKADLSRSGDWLLHGTRWDDEPRAMDIRLQVAPARTKVTHRGREVEVTEVRIERVGKDASIFRVDAQGRVLSLAPEGAPVIMLAGTDEEIGADVAPATAAGEPGVETPTLGVRVYLEVLMKARDVDALDTVMDWPAIFEAMSKENEEIAAIGAEGLRSVFKQQFSQTPSPFGKEELELALGMAEVELNGEDAATVTIPGAEDNPFRLRRGPRGWRLVAIPH